MTAYVYLIRLDGAPKYVGFTTQTIEKRWIAHRSQAKRAHNELCSDGPLQRAIRKYDASQFSVESLYESEDVEHTKTMEHHYIWLYRTFTDKDKNGYNLTSGGDAHNLSTKTKEKLRQLRLGTKHSPESCAKMSESRTGTRRSRESIEKSRLARVGKPRSKETKEKLRHANLGKTHSVETKEKIRKANIGRKMSFETLEKRRQTILKKKSSQISL